MISWPAEGLRRPGERFRWSERVRKSTRGPWRPRWRERDVNGVQIFLFRQFPAKWSGVENGEVGKDIPF